jgi:ElaB/YqjD/DUF883 family membrane-anchored ribosome-binding protein
MDPIQVASKLNQIADVIDNSKNPRRDLVAQDISELVSRISKKKKKKAPKSQKRGDCVFPHTSKKVKDNKDHFPINSESQARNALSRANQYDKSPPWYDGSLQELVNAVTRKVHSKYPDIEISKESKKPGKGKGKGKKKKSSMTPDEASYTIRQIAAAIDNSENPRRDLVVEDINRVIATLFEEEGMQEQPVVEEGCMSCGEKGGHAPGCLYERSMREHQEKQPPPDYSM